MCRQILLFFVILLAFSGPTQAREEKQYFTIDIALDKKTYTIGEALSPRDF